MFLSCFAFYISFNICIFQGTELVSLQKSSKFEISVTFIHNFILHWFLFFTTNFLVSNQMFSARRNIQVVLFRYIKFTFSINNLEQYNDQGFLFKFLVWCYIVISHDNTFRLITGPYHDNCMLIFIDNKMKLIHIYSEILW